VVHSVVNQMAEEKGKPQTLITTNKPLLLEVDRHQNQCPEVKQTIIQKQKVLSTKKISLYK